ncbi:MAG: LysM peptidoglycan-binding domain-containing protein [Bacteroidota bacterium]
MPLRYSLTLLLLVIAIQAFSLDSLRIEKVAGKTVVIHEVEKGETLYSLSRRYGAEVSEVASFNEITDNALSLGQLLRIPIEESSVSTTQLPATVNNTAETIHTVKTGETLFSISQLYGLRVYQLKEMNGLNNNDISVGQELVIKNTPREEEERLVSEVTNTENIDRTTEISDVSENSADPLKPAIEDKDLISYKVQSGDDISSIATRYGVRIDSLKYWNQLTSDHLDIGQELKLKQKVDVLLDAPRIVKTPYGIKKRMVDQSGFVRIVEEGIALKIEDVIPTDKYLCLHRDQPVGSLVEVRNLMNNQKVFVKVVAKLPNTGLNENVLIRLTPVAFKRLGIIDPKARVEISYYEE